MKNISEYIESGIIEAYVLGLASPEEITEIEGIAMQNPPVQEAINLFSNNLEQYARVNAIEPDPLIKPLLMATIDYIDRMEKGEAPSFPAELNENSTIADYEEWLNRPDMVLPATFKDVYAKLISHTSAVTSAIVWIEKLAPQEVHHDEYEKFLIVEGSCEITVGDEVHHMDVGDYFAIPLFKKHMVTVTSTIPCKVILQRIAA